MPVEVDLDSAWKGSEISDQRSRDTGVVGHLSTKNKDICPVIFGNRHLLFWLAESDHGLFPGLSREKICLCGAYTGEGIVATMPASALSACHEYPESLSLSAETCL